MDFIANLLLELGKDLVRHQGVNLAGWIMGFFRKHQPDARAAAVQQLLLKIGQHTDRDIREMVRVWAAKLPAPLTAAQQEELTALLINISHGARFHSTHGTPRSSYLRCERWLEQLLSQIRPSRARGEAVGPGWREWKLEAFLGMGTFGEVWLGRNPLYPLPRAFKFFTHDGALDWLCKEQKNLFEIHTALKDHPNIIAFENVVIADQKAPFLVLEYAGGGSLEDWLLSHVEERLPTSPHRVIADVVRGLACAHEQEIYHRDLKPANIILTDDPKDVRAKITDFGLARVDRPQAGSSYRSQGAVVGTSMYLPPESLEILREREPAQDDIFAVGVIWYQLLVGTLERPPYDFVERLREKGVDSRTIRLVSRCLARADRRFPDACELEQSLEEQVLEDWPVPEPCFDVQHLVREYLATTMR